MRIARRLTCPLTLAAVTASGVANAQALDFARSDFAAGDAPRGLAAADFDQDGLLDLGVADEGTQRVLVLDGLAGGAFAAPSFAGFVGAQPRGLVAADLDGDGDVDLASASHSESSVSVLRNAGGASFTALHTTVVLPNPRWIVAADLDADGDIDLATPNENQGQVSLLDANGDASYAAVLPVPLVGGLVGLHMATGDLDVDGDTDLCVGVGSSFSYLSLMNDDGASTWSPVASNIGLGSSDWVAVGHFNADAFPDFAINTNDLGDFQTGVFLGTGTGAVQPLPAHAYLGCCTQSLTGAADFDGDGFGDLIDARSKTGAEPWPTLANLYRGTGTAAYAASIAHLPSGASDLAIRDFDLDGKLDIALACRDADEIAVLLQRVPAAPVVAVAHPAAVVVLQSTPGTLDLFGSGFTTLQTVKLNGVLKAFLSGVAVQDDAHVAIQLPNPIGTEWTLVIELVNAAGTTTTQLPIVAPPQPILCALAPFSKSAAGPDLHIGAQPGEVAFLAGSLDLLPTSIPGLVDLSIGNGFTSLVYLGAKTLPAFGWLPVHLPFGAIPPGTMLHFQFAALAPGAAFPLVASNVVSGVLGP